MRLFINVHPRITDVHPRITDVHPRITDVHPCITDVHPRITDVHPCRDMPLLISGVLLITGTTSRDNTCLCIHQTGEGIMTVILGSKNNGSYHQ